MFSAVEYLSLASQFKRFYNQQIGQAAEEYGLSQIEMDILLFLRNNPCYDTARDIVEIRHIAKSYVSKTVELLIRKGYLSALEDNADRRMQHLTLLPKADAPVAAGRKAQQAVQELLKAGISDEELAFLENIWRKLSDNIGNL